MLVQEHTMVPSRLEEMGRPVQSRKEPGRKFVPSTMESDTRGEQGMPELDRQQEQGKKERSNLGKMVPGTRVLGRKQELVRTREPSRLVAGRQEGKDRRVPSRRESGRL